MRFALLTVVILAACTQPRSKMCTDICARENDCVQSTSSQIPFDEKECVVACEMLRNDQKDSLAKVEQHKECVLGHPSCTDVLQCP
ncbi:MAG TPA: hypothetical protein VLB44_04875 [Kofleriaceae bacterium]|nr:hypothetical protein [Kofleriaceae bacterium]